MKNWHLMKGFSHVIIAIFYCCVAGDPADSSFHEIQQTLHKLIEVTCGDGALYMPEGHLTSQV